MSSERSLAMPIAVVVGSAIIGVSLFFGLREGLRPPPAAPAAATPAAPATVPATPPPPAKPSEPPADRAFRQAQAALDRLRPGLVKACWTPPAAGEPATILLTYDITFSATGQMITLGISEQREAYRAGVADCVRKQPLPVLPVDPPGENVRVVLGLQMP